MKRLLAPLLVALVVASCRQSSTHLPERHRAVARACPSTRAPGYTSPTRGGPLSGDCDSDSDCTAGKNGRCSPPGHRPSSCSYDTCTSDADCDGSKVCNCDPYRGNRCLPGNCKADADCSGLGCSPTRPTSCGNLIGTVGFYCHTKTDACIDDSDCKQDGAMGGMCVYEPSVARWTCNYHTCDA